MRNHQDCLSKFRSLNNCAMAFLRSTRQYLEQNVENKDAEKYRSEEVMHFVPSLVPRPLPRATLKGGSGLGTRLLCPTFTRLTSLKPFITLFTFTCIRSIVVYAHLCFCAIVSRIIKAFIEVCNALKIINNL